MNDDTLAGTAQSAAEAAGNRPAGLGHEAFDWAWAQPITNNPGARIVLLCLARHIDDTWECTASQEEIAADALLSIRSVRRHMEQLEADGHIQRQKRFDEKGRRLPDRCRLNARKPLPANLAGRQVNPMANLAGGDVSPSANLADKQVSPLANLAGGESNHRPIWPVVNQDETDTPSSEPAANLASGHLGHRSTWPLADLPKADIPRSEPAAKLTSGQIGRAISSSPSENYERETSSSRPQLKPTTKPADAPPREDVDQLCDRLLQWLIKKDYRQRPSSVSHGWRDAARKLLDLDEVPLQEAVDVLDWSQRDPFWHQNINSMAKFREKYGDLEMKSRGLRSGQIRQLRPTGTDGHQPYRNPTDQSIYDEEF